MTTGPLHWSLLTRCRAVDNQAFVIVASPARVTNSNYVAWGHSMVVDPWGKILSEATEEDTNLYLDLGKCNGFLNLKLNFIKYMLFIFYRL